MRVVAKTQSRGRHAGKLQLKNSLSTRDAEASSRVCSDKMFPLNKTVDSPTLTLHSLYAPLSHPAAHARRTPRAPCSLLLKVDVGHGLALLDLAHERIRIKVQAARVGCSLGTITFIRRSFKVLRKGFGNFGCSRPLPQELQERVARRSLTEPDQIVAEYYY